MTFQTYLRINGVALPVQKDNYTIDYRDVIADSGGVTEADREPKENSVTSSDTILTDVPSAEARSRSAWASSLSGGRISMSPKCPFAVSCRTSCL